MKAIIVARVSKEQKEPAKLLSAQIVRLEQYCISKNFDIIKIFSDFDELINFIVAHHDKIAVCCDTVYGITRNMFDKRVALLYQKALDDELELHFVADGHVLTSTLSAADRFQYSISLGLANYYADFVSDNVSRCQEQKLRTGQWLTKAPYGYKNVTQLAGSKDIIVDDYEAHIVKKAFELYATGIYSMDMVCDKLQADYGIVWIKSFLDKVLKRHFYYGVMEIKGQLYPHCYPPIINQALYNQVQNVKNSFNKSNTYKHAGHPFMYRGLLRCAHCGLAITPERHGDYVYYHCTQYNGKHGAKWLREEAITEQLSAVFKRLTMPPDVEHQIADTLNELNGHKIEFHRQQLTKLRKEQREIAKMMDNLYLDKLKEKITEREYDRFFVALCKQRDDVATRLVRLKEAEANYSTTAQCILDLTQHAAQLFEQAEIDEKRQLIKLLFSTVHIEGTNVVYSVQKPFDLLLACAETQHIQH